MGLRFIGHLDTLPAVARLHKLTHGDPWKGTPDCAVMDDADLPHKTLLLRCQKSPSVENFPEDLPMHDGDEFGGKATTAWRNLVARARRLILSDLAVKDWVDAAAPLGRVVISVLAAKGVMSWHKDVGDYAKRHLRFHIPLQTNPECMLYSGNAQAHIPVGMVTWVDVLDLHCAANWGKTPRSHLIFELRRRDASDGE